MPPRLALFQVCTMCAPPCVPLAHQRLATAPNAALPARGLMFAMNSVAACAYFMSCRGIFGLTLNGGYWKGCSQTQPGPAQRGRAFAEVLRGWCRSRGAAVIQRPTQCTVAWPHGSGAPATGPGHGRQALPLRARASAVLATLASRGWWASNLCRAYAEPAARPGQCTTPCAGGLASPSPRGRFSTKVLAYTSRAS